MQKKIVVGLMLIVLLPVALLAWLGLRMAHNEHRVLQVAVLALVNAQLGTVDDALKGYFQDVQADLLGSLAQMDLSNDGLKNFSRESPRIKQVLVIGADGKRVFPPPDAILSDAEKQFLQRTSAIWENPGILTQGAALTPPAVAANAPPPRQKIASGRSAAADDEGARPQSGWYAWHWNAELHQLFWWRDPRKRLIGFELAPVAVLSQIIARLPATDNQATQAASATRLINGNGQIVYEWGQYRPRADEKSLSMLPLGHPLGSWKLEYYAPALQGGASADSFGILAAVLAIGAALGGLAFYLYREHSRELRMAQQRVNFVNQVSHELKTPLTNIRLYAELLETELDGVFEDLEGGEGGEAGENRREGARANKYLAIITSESQRLSRLIANVLSFGQFQKNQPRLSLQAARVDDVIRRCIGAFQAALDAKGIALRFEAHAGALAMLDPEALEQILNNLIGNVEKYAFSGRALHIQSAQERDVCTIEVRDFGPGIAGRERGRVFQPFYRISSLLTDGVAGTGIGLDIARQLARLHGGDVTLADVADGGDGACFRVVLQARPVNEFIEK